MNPCKIPNSNWILCQSKRFPGKIYFFNVSTGEAVWSYNDTEKTGVKSQVQDEEHTYPEPNTPPDKSPSPLRQLPCTPYNGHMYQNSFLPTNPSLNNNMAVSMYVPPFDNGYMRSVMPYQYPSPMMWPPPMFMPYFGPNTNVPLWPVAPQTKLIEQKPMSQDVTVHSGKQPLSTRFTNYRDSVIKFKDKHVTSQIYNTSNSNVPEFGCDESPKKSLDSESPCAKIQREPNLNLTSGLIIHDKENNNFPTKDRNNNNANKFLSVPDSPLDKGFNQQQQKTETFIQNQNKLFEPNHKFKHNKQTQTNQHTFGKSPKFDNTLLKVNQSNAFLSSISDQKHSLSYQNTRDQNFVVDPEYDKTHESNVCSGNSEVKTKLSQQSSSEDHYDQTLSVTNTEIWAKQNETELTNQFKSNKLMFDNKQLNTRGPRNQIHFAQHHIDDNLHNCSVQTQYEQKVVSEDQTCFNSLQTDYKLPNLLQQCDNEKSALKQRTKDEFPAKSVLEEPIFFEDRNYENNSPHKGENRIEIITQEEILNVGENDLRRVLLAKKRKFADLITTPINESTKIKTTRQDNAEITCPKKKVTFNPVLDIFSDVSAENSANADAAECEEDRQNKCWYVVADTMTLLREYEIIEQFVKSDPYCTLVIPHRVMSDTVTVSRRQCPGNRLVTRARHLLRTLDTRPAHVMLQASGDKSPSASSVISILHCCLDIMENARLVLITNDEYLRKKAENIGVDCFVTQDIKLAFTTEPFSVNYDTGHTEVNDGRETFQTHASAKLNTPSNNIVGLPYYNENIDYKNNVVIRKSIGIENRSVNENENIKGEDVDSKRKRADEKLSDQTKKCSKFDTDKSKLKETKHSISENAFVTDNGNSKTNSTREYNKIIRKQVHDTEIKGNDSQKSLQSSVLESANEGTQQKEADFHKTNTADTTLDLEEFLKMFLMKNMDLEHVTEQKKDEIICSFRQIMEEFSMEVLKDHKNLLEKHGMRPPFSLKESIHCLGLVYGEHASVRETVDILSSVLDSKGEVPRSEAVRSCACAMALVQSFKSVCGAGEPAAELGARLRAVLVGARAPPLALPSRPHAAPAPDIEPAPRKNFEKGRSEVFLYLKKHFPAWADYDESLWENNPTQCWGKSYKENMVVRIRGKSLNKLTLNNCKPMSIKEPDSSTSSPKEPKVNTLKIINMTQSLDPRIYTKQTPQLAAIPDNETNKNQNTNQNIVVKKNDQNVDENQNIKEPETKVVRLFSNYNFTKKSNEEVNIPKHTLEDNFETHGHTFGTAFEHGPKILRNIKPIKEFEVKLKRRPLDADEFDYSTISLTGYEHFAKQIKSCHLENGSNSQANAFAPTNDHLDLTNDTATNTRSYSMSLEHSLTNNCILDSKNNISEIGDSKIDMTNSRNWDCMSFDTSGFDELFGITDDFKVPNSGDNFEVSHGQKNYVFGQKDDNMYVSKDDKSPSSENMSENSFRLVSSFLNELKVSFDAIHKFIGSSVSALGGSQPADAVQRARLHAHARDTQRRLYAVVSILDRIVYRETVSGKRMRELFKGTLFEDDHRLRHYSNIVPKCVEHVVLLNEALKMLQQLTAPAGDSCPTRRYLPQ